MKKVLTIAEMREADSHTINDLKISSEVLMHRAGSAIADEVAAVAAKSCAILVVCGTGNNGGDGYVCAQTLLDRGYDIKVYAFDGNLSVDCAREKEAYRGCYTDIIDGDIIVDCIFGTGLNRTVPENYAAVIQKINQSGAIVFSADIPSGLNGDNGLVEGCAVKANVTVAVGEYKTGYFLNDGVDYCGKIIKKDIGIVCNGENYAQIFSDGDIAEFFPERKRNSHKGTYGTAQLVVGSDKYYGAAVLASEAALKSGCGYVKVNTGEGLRACLAVQHPQLIFNDDIDLSAECIAIGSGCGVSQNLYNTLLDLFGSYTNTLIIDADGLNSLSTYGVGPLGCKKCKVVITPHVKEFSRLTGFTVEKILRDPIFHAKMFAQVYGVTVLLKGAVSVLTDGKRTYLLVRGNSALAKGGSGDMLTGLACGTAARGVEGIFAIAAASYALGYSAEMCAEEETEYCVTAGDIIKNLHFAIRSLTD